jgi:hypothetical protein
VPPPPAQRRIGPPQSAAGPDLAERPGDDITVPELGGGTQLDREVEFAVTEGGIREVLADTGLFSSLGPKRMGWAHRTFAEYLAARYVVGQGQGVEQVRGLILHLPGRVVQWDEGDYRRGDAGSRLPPTLVEARSLLQVQAEELSAGDRRVVAVVLDCTLS